VVQIPYDVLIVAVGAVNNTFHTPGVREHAFFLKEVRCKAVSWILAALLPTSCLSSMLSQIISVQTGDAALLRNRMNECVAAPQNSCPSVA